MTKTRAVTMTRIRTVKPDLHRHDGLFDAETKHKLPLRLAFIALFSCCDRSGRFRWRPRQLKLDMLPYDNVDISKVLDALVMEHFVIKYKKEDKIYGCIPSWELHQCINNRESESIIPSYQEQNVTILDNPNQKEYNSLENKDILTRGSRVGHTSQTCTSMHVQDQAKGEGEGEGEGEGKGREGKGKNSLVKSKIQPLSKLAKDKVIELIFDHWKKIMHSPNSCLDSKRKKVITQALDSGYSQQQLCDAITGCSRTAYNMGENDRGKKYNSVELILRDADHIDRFIGNLEPAKMNNVQRLNFQKYVEGPMEWAREKMAIDVDEA